MSSAENMSSAGGVRSQAGTDGGTSASLTRVPAFGAGALLATMGAGTGGGVSIPAPFSEPTLILEDVHVAGTTHVDGILALAGELAEGARLRLERDPANRYDRWSIRVFDAKGGRLGFVPADVNEIPARLMDGGKSLFAQVTAVEQRGSWTRIGMDVYLDD